MKNSGVIKIKSTKNLKHNPCECQFINTLLNSKEKLHSLITKIPYNAAHKTYEVQNFLQFIIRINDAG